MRHSGRSVKPKRTVTTPTYRKQSFRQFKKLNAPKSVRSLSSLNRRR